MSASVQVHAVATRHECAIVARSSSAHGDADEKPSSRDNNSRQLTILPLHIPRGLKLIWGGGIGAGIGSGILRPPNAEVRVQLTRNTPPHIPKLRRLYWLAVASRLLSIQMTQM